MVLTRPWSDSAQRHCLPRRVRVGCFLWGQCPLIPRHLVYDELTVQRPVAHPNASELRISGGAAHGPRALNLRPGIGACDRCGCVDERIRPVKEGSGV